MVESYTTTLLKEMISDLQNKGAKQVSLTVGQGVITVDGRLDVPTAEVRVPSEKLLFLASDLPGGDVHSDYQDGRLTTVIYWGGD